MNKSGIEKLDHKTKRELSFKRKTTRNKGRITRTESKQFNTSAQTPEITPTRAHARLSGYAKRSAALHAHVKSRTNGQSYESAK